jgi:hypothetical protein
VLLSRAGKRSTLAGRPPAGPADPVPRCLPAEPGHDRWPPARIRPAGWSPFAGIARIRLLGSPFSLSAVRASQLSGPLSLPVATPVTRRLVRSSSLDHLADDAHAARRQRRAPRAKSPDMQSRTSCLRRKPGQRSGPYPVPMYGVPAASPRRPAPHDPDQRRKPLPHPALEQAGDAALKADSKALPTRPGSSASGGSRACPRGWWSRADRGRERYCAGPGVVTGSVRCWPAAGPGAREPG